MGSIPYAASLHSIVSSVGADAGFAAIVGLAILVLLYFAQAREAATLREQAHESSERLGQLEARLAELARGGIAPAPQAAQAPQAAHAAQGAPAAPRPAVAPRPAGVPASTAAPRPAMALGPPAGVAAPALAAATRLVPLVTDNGGGRPLDWPSEPIKVQRGEPVSAEATAVAPAGAGAPAAAPPHPAEPAPAEPAPADPAPAAATVAGGNGVGRGSVPPVPTSPRRRTEPGVGGPPRRPAAAPRPVAAARPSAAARRPLLPPEPPPRRSPMLKAFAVLLGLLVVAGAAVALLIATSTKSTSSPASASRTTNAPGSAGPGAAASFNPASVTVAVLNGTGTTGLAHRTAVRLASAGYREGTVATATDQTHTATQVAYLPGFRNDALKVAASLKLSSGSVQPIDPATKAVACPPPAPCTANVVVTVGSDLASVG